MQVAGASERRVVVWDDLRATWKDTFSVGDPLIDSQHREFFDDICQVARALAEGAGREAVTAFYRKFVAGLSGHFRDEEALMERVRYPDIEIHRAEHEALMGAVTAVEGMLITSNSPDELQFIVKRLFTALIEHIVSEDMRYKTHVLADSGL